MNSSSTGSTPAPGTPASQKVDSKRTWIIVLAVTLVLLLCSCVATVFLVLTGIIAEPETVIEQILRALFGD